MTLLYSNHQSGSTTLHSKTLDLLHSYRLDSCEVHLLDGFSCSKSQVDQLDDSLLYFYSQAPLAVLTLFVSLLTRILQFEPIPLLWSVRLSFELPTVIP